MQITDRFGPIPVSVVLDGSGNGTVSFQPNGKNARITTLFVKASTAVNQATCTLYKGQVSDSNVIGNTNSGSTGAPAWGQIDLLDGETIYVVWRGGDAGATAVATFVGVALPFDQIGAPYLQWSDPIAAGDGSLIFPALKSPNYVAGVSGWKLDRNGNIEVNDAVLRGELDVNGASNSYIRVFNFAGVTPVIQLSPGDFIDGFPTPLTGLISAQKSSAPVHQGQLVLIPPAFGADVGIYINSDSWENGVTDSSIDLHTYSIQKNGNDIGGGWVAGGGLTTVQTAVNNTETVQISAFTASGGVPTYKANRAYRIESSVPILLSNVATQCQFRIRKTNTAGQQLDAWNGSCAALVTTGCKYTSYFIVGSTDVSATIVLTIMANAVNSAQVRAFTTSPATFHIYEDGTAASRSWAATLI